MTEAKFLVWDVESGGTDVFSDRVVQLVISLCDAGGNVIEKHEWIINPGVEIAQGAIDVHGLSNEYLADHGQDPVTAFTEAIEVFGAHKDITWVAYNLAFDLSILDSEFKRHNVDDGFGEWANEEVKLFDPLVVDRHKDRWRKGGRKLVNTAKHYGIPFSEAKAHEAGYDCEVTAKVAVKIAAKYGVPTNKDQSLWYDKWAEGLEKYFQRTDPEQTVDRGWPLKKGD